MKSLYQAKASTTAVCPYSYALRDNVDVERVLL